MAGRWSQTSTARLTRSGGSKSVPRTTGLGLVASQTATWFSNSKSSWRTNLAVTATTTGTSNLEWVAMWCDPVVERTYPFAEAPQALAHVEGGRAKGKVVVAIV